MGVNGRKARVLIEVWRQHYNTVRSHSSLSQRPSTLEGATPPFPAFRFRFASTGNGDRNDNAQINNLDHVMRLLTPAEPEPNLWSG